MQTVTSEKYGDKPREVEITPTCVFVRSNCKEFHDGRGSGWTYDETKMTHVEYTEYVTARQQEKILDVQEAMAEIYEQMIAGGE